MCSLTCPALHISLLFSNPVLAESAPLPTLSGVPVLFLPGNAGSHKQARSSASIALRMHGSEFPHKKRFNFFTVNFDEARTITIGVCGCVFG